MVRKEYEHKAKLVNDRPVLHCRFGKNKPWVDITRTRHNVDNLTLLDHEGAEFKVSDCKVELVDFIFRIFLEFVCCQIKYNDTPIWFFTGDLDNFNPQSISFDLVKNSFFLDTITEKSIRIDACHYVLGGQGRDGDNGVLDLEDPLNEKNKHMKVREFSDYVKTIKYGRKTIWKHKKGEPYPLKCIADEKKRERYVIFENKYLIVKNKGNKWDITEHPITPDDELYNYLSKLH
ncbi:hypothetical protein TpMuguga_04g00408 [Theileria parva strain Muguga]|uniref:Uncharacterized protein n=1 Tax=Theileria parva TaxID=5875 RepID=Q4N2E1_THEPA|nr:uncharacterized protein TpMuguga_04g00408 [Theileria parva strain Muguga]EAN31760.1 hypothetical protein TpMuguga_04g00408 [Theileria parva strain Muguga]|eukprot:XP_764043.1 hypothetical protein [Theileria parva strain Muguga]